MVGFNVFYAVLVGGSDGKYVRNCPIMFPVQKEKCAKFYTFRKIFVWTLLGEEKHAPNLLN